jgi:hypothetical protein
MNYLKCYIDLVNKAKSRKFCKNEYVEKHHIIPKSIFNNKKANNILNYFEIKFKTGEDNFVSFLPREHFIAHLLLLKIFKNLNTDAYEKMLYAATFLRSRVNDNKVNSKKYTSLRKAFSEMMSKKLTGKPSRAKGCKWSDKRRKIGHPHMKNKTYEEIYGVEKGQELRKKRSEVRLGKKIEEICSEEQAKILKYKLSNRTFSPEWRKKLSQAAKSRKVKQSTKDKISKFMTNRDINPNVDQQLYMFEHKDTKERIIKRKIDMKKDYGCNLIYKVIRGERSHNKRWMFISKVER